MKPLKSNEVDGKAYDLDDARGQVAASIETVYSAKRLHSALGHKTTGRVRNRPLQEDRTPTPRGRRPVSQLIVLIVPQQRGAVQSADAGYCSDANFAALEEGDVDAYIASGQAKHAADGEGGGARIATVCTKIKVGRHAPYRLRKPLPEPGQCSVGSAARRREGRRRVGLRLPCPQSYEARSRTDSVPGRPRNGVSPGKSESAFSFHTISPAFEIANASKSGSQAPRKLVGGAVSNSGVRPW
jgi:hypothetical protein